MPRPSNRPQRRRELALAYERVLARHGVGGATLAKVAEEAEVAPGLIHHHFEDREDLLLEVIRQLARRFRRSLPEATEPERTLVAYVDAALSLRGPARPVTARAWVGVLAEAIRSRRVARLLRRALRAELDRLARLLVDAGLSEPAAERAAAGVLSGILGALVFGALFPTRARGFAAPWVHGALRQALAGRAR